MESSLLGLKERVSNSLKEKKRKRNMTEKPLLCTLLYKFAIRTVNTGLTVDFVLLQLFFDNIRENKFFIAPDYLFIAY